MRWMALLLLVCLLAGCADAAPSRSPATSSGALSSTPLPTIEPPSGPAKTPTDSFKQVTLRGTLRVTSGCVELLTDTVTWTLLGLTGDVRGGERVEVVGLPAPDAETGCSGSPLRVSTATRIG